MFATPQAYDIKPLPTGFTRFATVDDSLRRIQNLVIAAQRRLRRTRTPSLSRRRILGPSGVVAVALWWTLSLSSLASDPHSRYRLVEGHPGPSPSVGTALHLSPTRSLSHIGI